MKNIPNAITIFRIILIPFFSYYLYNEYYWIATIIFAVASLSDIIDGYLARKFKVVSKFGKLADPLADKFLQLSALLILCLIGHLNGVFLLILLIKDTMLIAGGIILHNNKIVFQAQWFGKLSTVVLNSAIICSIFFELSELISSIVIGASIIVTLFALIMYGIFFVKELKNFNGQEVL